MAKGDWIERAPPLTLLSVYKFIIGIMGNCSVPTVISGNDRRACSLRDISGRNEIKISDASGHQLNEESWRRVGREGVAARVPALISRIRWTGRYRSSLRHLIASALALLV